MKKVFTENEKKEIQFFLLGSPIIKVKSNVIRADQKGSAIKNARNWARLNEQNICRQDIGIVIFNESRVKDSLSHGFGQKKLDAIQAVPEVIKMGKIVEMSSDFYGKPKENIVIMAPIQIEKEISILATRIVKNIGNSNRFYVHEVLDIPRLNKKGNTIRPSALDLTARPQGGTALYINILINIWDVK